MRLITYLFSGVLCVLLMTSCIFKFDPNDIDKLFEWMDEDLNGENEPPFCKLELVDNEPVFGDADFMITVRATDDDAVARVRLYIDDVLYDVLESAPYEFVVEKGKLNDGKHLIRATAIDSDGEMAVDEKSIDYLVNFLIYDGEAIRVKSALLFYQETYQVSPPYKCSHVYRFFDEKMACRLQAAGASTERIVGVSTGVHLFHAGYGDNYFTEACFFQGNDTVSLDAMLFFTITTSALGYQVVFNGGGKDALVSGYYNGAIPLISE